MLRGLYVSLYLRVSKEESGDHCGVQEEPKQLQVNSKSRSVNSKSRLLTDRPGQLAHGVPGGSGRNHSMKNHVCSQCPKCGKACRRHETHPDDPYCTCGFHELGVFSQQRDSVSLNCQVAQANAGAPFCYRANRPAHVTKWLPCASVKVLLQSRT